MYRVLDRKTGKNYAAKFIRCSALEKGMIKQEIDIMNDLHHPKLLQLHEAFEQPGEMVLILEL